MVSVIETHMHSGISNRIFSLSTAMGNKAAVRPNIPNTLNILEPTTLPIATSAFPSNAPMKLTTNSGIEVPIPTMAAPITKSDTLYLRAIAAAPATNISAPKPIPTKEIIRMMYSIIQQLTMYK